MNDSLCNLSAVELAAAVRTRKVSPVEVTGAVLVR
jgi:Asp-tRNA(Asn)/Glu-tRNA(Gln) amidotransferase A subunit family amidase